MAQFDFYGLKSDWMPWLKAIAAMNRFTFVINTIYDRPHPTCFREITSVIEADLQARQYLYLFLRPDEYASAPFEFGDPVGKSFRIHPSLSGPLLTLDLPASTIAGDKTVVGRGLLFYQPLLQNAATGETSSPPALLRSLFDEVKSLLRARLIKRYVCGGISARKLRREVISLWISEDALKDIESGRAVIKSFNVEFSAGDLKQSPGELRCDEALG